jgi:hypothetical protein
MLIDGEKVDYMDRNIEDEEISIYVSKDYSMLIGGSSVLLWKRDQREPIVYRISLDTLHFNNEICYIIEDGRIDNSLRIIPTELFLGWLLTLPKQDGKKRPSTTSEEEIKHLTDSCQIGNTLGIMGNVPSISKMDNIGHIFGYTAEGNEYLIDIRVKGNAEIKSNLTCGSMCPRGKYVTSVVEIPSDESKYGIVICEYVRVRETSGQFIPIEETIFVLNPITEPYPIEGDSKCVYWIDSETILLYADSAAVLINAVTKEVMDITEHTERSEEDASSSEEVFILDNGLVLTIETAEKWSNYMRSRTVRETDPRLIESVSDKIYKFIS